MKTLTLIFMVFFLGSFYSMQMEQEDIDAVSSKHSNGFHVEVLTILENKCNECHLKRKRIVFDEKNIETWATKINEQVFIKKRMPKGKDNPLTAQELEVLKNWLDSLGEK